MCYMHVWFCSLVIQSVCVAHLHVTRAEKMNVFILELSSITLTLEPDLNARV